MSEPPNLKSPADFSSDDRIQAFIEAFESGLLPKACWTHQAHLVAGLWYLTRHGPDNALEVVRQRIRRYNESVGTPNTNTGGYHETLTRFFLAGIARHLASHPPESLPDTVASLLQSPLADKDWPLRFYSRELLLSPAARRNWVEPDLRSEAPPWPPPPGPIPSTSTPPDIPA